MACTQANTCWCITNLYPVDNGDGTFLGFILFFIRTIWMSWSWSMISRALSRVYMYVFCMYVCMCMVVMSGTYMPDSKEWSPEPYRGYVCVNIRSTDSQQIVFLHTSKFIDTPSSWAVRINYICIYIHMYIYAHTHKLPYLVKWSTESR